MRLPGSSASLTSVQTVDLNLLELGPGYSLPRITSSLFPWDHRTPSFVSLAFHCQREIYLSNNKTDFFFYWPSQVVIGLRIAFFPPGETTLKVHFEYLGSDQLLVSYYFRVNVYLMVIVIHSFPPGEEPGLCPFLVSLGVC